MVFHQERSFQVQRVPPHKKEEAQPSPFLIQTEVRNGSPPTLQGSQDSGLPCPSQGLLSCTRRLPTEDPGLRGGPGTAGCQAQLAPFLPSPFCPWRDWAPLGALNVNSPPLPQLSAPLSKGLLLPLLPPSPSTGLVGAGPPWVLSLEAGFVCEVHLQGWETLLTTAEREGPGLGVHGKREEGCLETPLERNSSQMCSLQVSKFGALPHFFQSYRFAGLPDHYLSRLPAASRHARLWAPSFPQPVFVTLGLLLLFLTPFPHLRHTDQVSKRSSRGPVMWKTPPHTHTPQETKAHAPFPGVQALER